MAEDFVLTIKDGTKANVAEYLIDRMINPKSSIKEPIQLALTGEGNAGKTTVAYEVCTILGSKQCAVVEIDNFAVSRRYREEIGCSGYDPRSFDIVAYSEAIKKLASGLEVRIPYYDHGRGESCADATCALHQHIVKPSAFLIGVGVFLWDQKHFSGWDLSVFFRSVSSSTREERILRDTRERGYSQEYAERHFNMCDQDQRKYIDPSVEFCDYLITTDTVNWTHSLYKSTRL